MLRGGWLCGGGGGGMARRRPGFWLGGWFGGGGGVGCLFGGLWRREGGRGGWVVRRTRGAGGRWVCFGTGVVGERRGFEVDPPEDRVVIKSPLSGRVNVSNLLAAMCAALARGLTIDEVSEAVEKLRPVPGRFEVVDGSEERKFTVVVDYAHTDDALRNLIALAGDMVKEGGGRVITLFGCGGGGGRAGSAGTGAAGGGRGGEWWT